MATRIASFNKVMAFRLVMAAVMCAAATCVAATSAALPRVGSRSVGPRTTLEEFFTKHLDTSIPTLSSIPAKMAAGDLHELLRAWENYHRIWCVETHIRHIEFRKESRYPGFYYRSDFPVCDDENWKCFVNSTFDPKTKEWKCEKVNCVNIIETEPWI